MDRGTLTKHAGKLNVSTTAFSTSLNAILGERMGLERGTKRQAMYIDIAGTGWRIGSATCQGDTLTNCMPVVAFLASVSAIAAVVS